MEQHTIDTIWNIGLILILCAYLAWSIFDDTETDERHG
jgi:hypothetical protein